jgi:hypothetical protein
VIQRSSHSPRSSTAPANKPAVTLVPASCRRPPNPNATTLRTSPYGGHAGWPDADGRTGVGEARCVEAETKGHRYGGEVAREQDYCDWCYGPIESDDRERSRELGLDEESLFACGDCVSVGRVYSPPEGWEGTRDRWPVRDISDQLELARENVEVVLADLHRTTGIQPNVTVDSYVSAVRIAYGTSYTTPSVQTDSNPHALAETADYLQDHVTEDLWSPWPVCPVHDVGVYAKVHDGAAVWWCRSKSHVVATVGRYEQLAHPAPDILSGQGCWSRPSGRSKCSCLRPRCPQRIGRLLGGRAEDGTQLLSDGRSLVARAEIEHPLAVETVEVVEHGNQIPASLRGLQEREHPCGVRATQRTP